MNRLFAKASLLALALLPALAGCMRGGISSDPPVHLVLDMDFQPKLRAQGAADFDGWKDGRASRLPVIDPVAMEASGKPAVRPIVVAQVLGRFAVEHFRRPPRAAPVRGAHHEQVAVLADLAA